MSDLCEERKPHLCVHFHTERLENGSVCLCVNPDGFFLEIITACIRRIGEVLFSQESVCPQLGEGVNQSPFHNTATGH